MKTLVYIGIIACFSFCCTNRQSTAKNQLDNDTSKTKIYNGNIVISTPKPQQLVVDKKDYQHAFAYDNEGIKQVLLIKFQNKALIFNVVYSNGDKKTELKGTAQLLNIGEESLVDENGNGYDVAEYIYKSKNCNLILRIDEKFKAATILPRNCATAEFSDFSNDHIMKKF